jgi:hypothetical protein
MRPDRSTRWIHRATTAGVVAWRCPASRFRTARCRSGAYGGCARPAGVAVAAVVDGFIAVASLAVLHAVLEHRSTVYPWILVLGFSAVSVVFNVVHAPTPVAGLVAAVPPLALVLSSELLMRQVRAALEPEARPRHAAGPGVGEWHRPAIEAPNVGRDRFWPGRGGWSRSTERPAGG